MASTAAMPLSASSPPAIPAPTPAAKPIPASTGTSDTRTGSPAMPAVPKSARAPARLVIATASGFGLGDRTIVGQNPEKFNVANYRYCGNWITCCLASHLFYLGDLNKP